MADEPVVTGYMRLVPTTEGINAALGNQFSGAGAESGKRFGASFVPTLRNLLLTAGGVLLAREVKDFVSQGVAALSRIDTINAQTANVIKSTGGAAKVSAADVESLANALERKTATEAESIQSGANLLLTFKNIRNEAGAGNDIFNQTVAAMTDVARAMGTDASGSAIQLGKALNDPIAGISALTRVGITFTDQQKEQIKALVEAGDVMAAQKIILGELQSQFGGSGAAYAATFAGKLDLVENSAGNLQERLVGGLMPGFESFLDLANNVLTRIDQSPAFDGIVAKINSIGTEGADRLERVVDLIDRLTASDEGVTGGGVLAGLAEIFPELDTLFEAIETVSPVLPDLADGFVKVVDALVKDGTLDALTVLVIDLLPVLVQLLLAAAPAIPPVTELIQALTPALKTFADNLTFSTSALGWLAAELGGNEDALGDWFYSLVESGNGVIPFANSVMSTIGNMVNGVITLLNSAGDSVEDFINDLLKAAKLPASLKISDISKISIPQITGVTVGSGKSAGSSSRPKIPGMATGGVVERAGYSFVGEAGPELLRLPVGAEVRPLDRISELAGGAGFTNNGTIITQDVREFMAEQEKLQRRNLATAGIESGVARG